MDIWAIVKTLLCQRPRIWLERDITRKKDQLGFSSRLHYIATCAPTCAEHDFWPILLSQLFQIDRLVSYPLVYLKGEHSYISKHLRDNTADITVVNGWLWGFNMNNLIPKVS